MSEHGQGQSQDNEPFGSTSSLPRDRRVFAVKSFAARKSIRSEPERQVQNTSDTEARPSSSTSTSRQFQIPHGARRTIQLSVKHTQNASGAYTSSSSQRRFYSLARKMPSPHPGQDGPSARTPVAGPSSERTVRQMASKTAARSAPGAIPPPPVSSARKWQGRQPPKSAAPRRVHFGTMIPPRRTGFLPPPALPSSAAQKNQSSPQYLPSKSSSSSGTSAAPKDRAPAHQARPNIIMPVKTMNVIAPLWLSESSRTSGSAKRRLNSQTGRLAAPRMTISSVRASGRRGAMAPSSGEISLRDSSVVTKGYLGPNMRLRVEGESHDEEDVAQTYNIKAARKSQVARKSARKLFSAMDENTTDSSTTSEEEPEDSSGGSSPPESDEGGDGGPELDFILPSIHDNLDTSPEGPPEELVTALEALTLSSLQMKMAKKLPFLPRNLRRGFESRCRLAGVPTSPVDHPLVSANIIYQCKVGHNEGTAQVHEHQARMRRWCCPLCELLGVFKTREMLAKHLEWDHPEVKCSWKKINETEPWQITCTIPEAREEPQSLTRSPTIDIGEPETERENQDFHSQSVRDAPSPTQAKDKSPTRFMPTPFREKSISTSPQRRRQGIESALMSDPAASDQDITPSRRVALELFPTPPRQSARSPVRVQHTSPVRPGISAESEISTTETTSPPPLVQRSHFPSPSVSYRQPLQPSSRSQSKRAPPGVSRQPVPSRYPTPPPPSDPLGPSAQYPFLPFISEGRIPVYYSCRPGGPRLYDLLNALSMEPYGVLSWYVIDKEEEIFECDDVRDEDKVMQALWARWILLNRNRFVANYFKGTMAFVDTFWDMIHRAAGWAALRTWLLVLVVNRFLTGSEVAKILRHYQDYTGMDYWYNDEESAVWKIN